ncbi:MAG: ABC transporter permease, partial [Eubacterium sp.]|nr:ABC transporter permease [Eubacterium sp.]
INSFNSNIKERKQQIGMLRAVGTTRRQIVKILGREALIISLVSIPVSLVISYLFVLALSNVFGEEFVLTIDVLSIICCGAVGLITVMLAALIPIIHATRITPMQAIRNIAVSRKMKTKKIKSQKDFSVPKLLAKRSMAFHKGNQIAVSILLVSTILFSCLGFSSISYEFSDSNHDGFDYRSSYISCGGDYTNALDGADGVSDIDKQNICSTPYITNAYGVKECNMNIFIDGYTDYFRIFANNVFNDLTLEEDIDISNITTDEYLKLTRSEFSNYYTNIKSQAGYEKDYLPTTLLALDDWKLETLKNHLISGEINLDKLASGEEIILIAPQKAALQCYENRMYSVWFDDEIYDGLDYALYGECEYKAGDTIDLSLLFGDTDDSIYGETKNTYNFERVDKKVKIGAVISPNYFNASESDHWMIMGSSFCALTSIAGMNRFAENEKYHGIFMHVNGEITDEIDEMIT